MSLQDINSPTLGPLKYKPKDCHLAGKLPFEGRDVIFQIVVESESRLNDAVVAAENFFTKFETHVAAARVCVTADMLEAYNANVHLSGEPVLSADEFQASLEVVSVQIHPTQSAYVSFCNDELFGDHAMSVIIDSEGNCELEDYG